MGKSKFLSFFLIPLFLVFGFSSSLQAKTELLKEKSFKVEAGGKVTVAANGADILLKTWDKNEVNVKIFGDKSKLKHLKIKFRQDGNKVYIELKRRKGSFLNIFGSSSGECKVLLKVPVYFKASLNTTGGDILVKGLKGKVSTKTSGGDIVSKNCEGDLNAKTSGGDVSVKKHKGKLYIATSGGDISVGNDDGGVSAFTSGGDVMLTVRNGKVDAKTSGGDISLNYKGTNYGISLATTGGDILLKLPKEIKADVELRALGGDLEMDFPSSQLKKITRNSFLGTFNGGGKSLKAFTSGGDVEVRGE